MEKRRNRRLFMISALCAICMVNCTWQAKVFYPDAFQTGAVLDRGENETAVNLPANVSLAHGFTGNGLEAGLMLGASGFNVGGIGIEIKKSVTNGHRLISSIGIKPELVFNGGENFAGWRGILTYAVGYRVSEDFSLFLPVKGSFSHYDHDGAKGNGISVIPGLGIGFESARFSLRLGGNIPFPPDIDMPTGNVIQFPYAALQLSFRP